ncbi:GTP 3',8-cyclase MoaA [Natranaerofaba carboxydovora]|uniref:GTP 3',8-cyclase MoaA n=1 Tax=Natranaerofaba carboxydovora TaxID=2742683 RepID=UPI001F12CC29|nr:GTP 3',8-cyclase MoaA [Natranaerofaba carboxydovora]UMZ73195.1 GTP 3',8-cyclase [Natranaerofaba carboxydovora]
MKQFEDEYGRNIDYLRVSITDRCNLRCVYCMPADGIEKLECDELLNYEELYDIIGAGADLGLKKIRFTGGEPLVRKGFVNLVKKVNEIESINDIAITTNGILLDKYARELKDAGLNRVNISLDTLNREKFEKVTRGGNLDKVFDGIKAAKEVGLWPVKINVVVMKDFNYEEILDFVKYSHEEELEIRFIEYMPIGEGKDWKKSYVSISELKKHCSSFGELLETSSTNGNGPAKYYRFENSNGKIGFISPVSKHFCDSCNRLRLTSDGKIKNCLFSEGELDLRKAVKSKEEIKNVFMKAVQDKPLKHQINVSSDSNDKIRKQKRNMMQIGG